jgi:phosphoribosylformimino-5-aminoimidazole carboxamide ribotide isomerase
VVQIVGGSLRKGDAQSAVTNFETDRSPLAYAQMYKTDNVPGGHVIALGPGNHAAALSALRAFPGGLQMGGGITPTNAKAYLEAGASHVMVTAYVFQHRPVDMTRLEALVTAVGKQR